MKNNIKWNAFCGLLITALLAGCVGDEGAAPSLPPVTSDLSLGATGDQVRTLNEYLTRRGYYPNADLAAQYPAWRPVTAAPVDPSVFDERTAEAVRRLQANLGIAPTGTVEASLRDLMNRPVCGVPDNIAALDGQDKFSLIANQQFPRGHVTWRLMNLDTELDDVRTHNVLFAAFSFWSVASGSGIIFDEVPKTSPAKITIKFGDLGAMMGGKITTASTNTDTDVITFNTQVVWTDVPGIFDMQSAATHEIGHVIGFNHSAWSDSIMFPTNRFFREWSTDDLVAATAVYHSYATIPGHAIDIAVSANDDMWAISRNATSGNNFQVVKWVPYANNWVTPADFSEGSRIAVEADGTPWVVKANGDIFRRTSNSTSAASWERKTTQKATDIGVGANGDVWIINRDLPKSGGFAVCKFTGSIFFCGSSKNPGGVRISVTASGRPWIVTSSNTILRHTTNDTDGGKWESVPGNVTDIAVGPEHPLLSGATTPIAFAWSVATKSSMAINVSAYAEQPFVDFGSAPSNVPKAAGWLAGVPITANYETGGPNLAIAVDGSGAPVIVTNLGDIYR